MVNKKIKVGITGQNGFVGAHLYNYLNLQEDIVMVDFSRNYFDDLEKLVEFVKSCDTIVHLAAKNRANDPQEIYDTNIGLVKILVEACDLAGNKPHVLFSSSTQEENNNHYGRSKLEGRRILENWAHRSRAVVTGMIIPNVFGPFGKPFYNSVVATFCHQVARNEMPTILNDSLVRLIYVNELTDEILQQIRNPQSRTVFVQANHEVTVSDLLAKLVLFKELYMKEGEIPNLDNSFDLALFNSFRCYIPKSHFPFSLTKHSDNRGSFVEILRANSKGQYSYSTTVPGITRGNHFHTRKVERFAVISGKASIELRRIGTEEVITYELDGENPSFVDMPIWHTHNIKNTGDKELVTLFWINEPYDPANADTYFEEV